MARRVSALLNGSSSRDGLGALVAASALLFSLACASTGSSAWEEDPSVPPEPAVLEVRNYNWSDLHVYVLAAGQRFSLGLVTSQQTRVFEIPDGAFATDRNLVFFVDPVGSRRGFATEPIPVRPGDRVAWTVHNNLAQSIISVF